MAIIGHDITLDGSLSDWLPTDTLYDNAATGYHINGTSNATNFFMSITAPTTIGSGTKVWFDTDRDITTGLELFGSNPATNNYSVGAEYYLQFDSTNTVSLYNAVTNAFVSNVQAAWSPDGHTVELAISKSASGLNTSSSIDTYVNVNNDPNAYLPGNFSGPGYTIFSDTGITHALDKRIGIVWSDTTAANFFSETAYSDLFMSAQSQAREAGVPFDILTESDLKDLSKLSHYDALVFPSFRNVQASDVTAITNTLQQAEKQFGLGLIVSGEFMTNDQNNNALPGDSYARMKELLDVTRVDVPGTASNVVVNAADPNSQVLQGYTNGQTIDSYTNVGWNAFQSVSGTGTTIATETINGTSTYAAAIATQTGGRNVQFATEGMMGDNNMLQQAISYVVDGKTPSVGLEMTRDAGLLAARIDMDQSQEADEVKPTNGQGIYDKLIPIVQSWKQQYDFVGSFYVNIGTYPNNPANPQHTDWPVSLPYYAALINSGNEIGTHSYSHPEDTNVLTASQLQTEFLNSKQELDTQLSNYLGTPYNITGAAVPGAPETINTSLAIMPYVDKYLTGGWTGIGSGYPNAFGYMTPNNQDKVYLAPNMVFDFTLVEYQKLTIAQAEAYWASEWNSLTANAQSPVIVWPFHDYGAAAWDSSGTSPYTTAMYTDFIARAASQNFEFVTLDDLASRIQADKAATLTTSTNGNVITATVAASNVGTFALNLDNQGTQVIENVAGWYAYDANSVFLPASGGTYTITLGAAQDNVTHIAELPMRASLGSLTGDGRNLSFSVVGEGNVTVDLANPGTSTVVVTGATTVSQAGDVLTLNLGANGAHDVSILFDNSPVITSNGGGDTAAISMPENGTAVTTVTATDPDPNTTLAYSITGGPDASQFAIDVKTGALSFKTAPDFDAPTDVGKNNVYDVVVQVSDGTLTDTQAIAVTVTNVVNELPVITSNGGGATAAISVPENSTAVTNVTAVDPDAGTPLSYSISGGADASKFTINPTTGALAFTTAPNFEVPTDVGANNVYDVIVRATGGGLTATQAIAVTVTDVKEAPTITSNGGGTTASISYAENGTAPVTTVTSLPGFAPDSIHYSLQAGGDSALFTINPTTGALSFINSPDYDHPLDANKDNIYLATVVATGVGGSDAQALSIHVTNVVNEPPVITSNGGGATAAISVQENTTAVTTVSATDPDAGTKLTYSISGGADAGKFSINGTTGALAFKTAPNVDVPTDVGKDNVYDVIVKAAGGGQNDTQAIAVTVTDAPGSDQFVFTSSSQSPPNKPETILGFEDGIDKIDLSAIDANSSLAGHNAFSFIGTSAFTGLGQLHYSYITGTDGNEYTRIEANISGNTNPEMAILLLGHHVLQSTDFIL
jgi:hypothetical protein